MKKPNAMARKVFKAKTEVAICEANMCRRVGHLIYSNGGEENVRSTEEIINIARRSVTATA